MEINEGTVKKIATLANLQVSEEESAVYASQLSKIVSFFEDLNNAHDELANNWRGDLNISSTPERDDVNTGSLETSVALSQSNRKTRTSFQVPKIIE